MIYMYVHLDFVGLYNDVWILVLQIIASHNTAGGAQQGSNKTTSTNKNDGVSCCIINELDVHNLLFDSLCDIIIFVKTT